MELDRFAFILLLLPKINRSAPSGSQSQLRVFIETLTNPKAVQIQLKPFGALIFVADTVANTNFSRDKY